MSRTNGTTIPRENYPTPPAYARQIVQNLPWDNFIFSVWEPMAGDGHICRAIREAHPNVKIFASEIRPECRDELKKWCDEVYIGSWEDDKALPVQQVSRILTNPPFSMTRKLLTKGIQRTNYDLIFLGADKWMHSAKRYGLHVKMPPRTIYCCTSRPSFTGDGKTDFDNYNWFRYLAIQPMRTTLTWLSPIPSGAQWEW